MRTAGTNNAVYDLLEPYPPDVQKLALAARKFILRIVPKATEMVDTKSKVIGFGFGTGYKDMICSLMPAKSWVTLGIGWGAELPDPQKLMEGAGKVHRHVKLKTEADLRNPALEALLKVALARSQSRETNTKARVLPETE